MNKAIIASLMLSNLIGQANAAGAKAINHENFDELTKGKNSFIKFVRTRQLHRKSSDDPRSNTKNRIDLRQRCGGMSFLKNRKSLVLDFSQHSSFRITFSNNSVHQVGSLVSHFFAFLFFVCPHFERIAPNTKPPHLFLVRIKR